MRRLRQRDVLEAVKVTDIVWTCDRCGAESVIEGAPRYDASAPPDSTPDDWVRVPGKKEDAAGRPVDYLLNPNDRFYCRVCWYRAVEALRS